MENNGNYLKVAKDMFFVQSVWTFGVLGVLLIINIVKIVIAGIQGNEADSYYNSVFIAANIYMLVIGIISTYFLPHYVENGVTRKDYFKGAALASIGLSVLIPTISLCISILAQFILKTIGNVNLKEPDINVIEGDSDLIGDIVQSIILSPYVNPESNWILAISIFALNIFIYYLAGWLIGAAFYRFDTIVGLTFILIALISVTMKDVLLRRSLDLPVLERFSSLDFPLIITIPGIFLIILIILWLIRLLTRRVAIKM